MKNLFLSFAAAMLMFGCCFAQSDKQHTGENGVVEKWINLWSTQNLEFADEIFAGDFIPHIPQYQNINDLETYKEEIKRTKHDIKNFKITLEDIFSDGDKTVGRFTVKGTFNGNIMNKKIEDTGYSNTWIIIFKFNNNKIAEEWWQFDLLGVMQQLGLIRPRPNGLPALSRKLPGDFLWGFSSNLSGQIGENGLNKSLIESEYQTWNKNNMNDLLKVIEEIYSPDFVYHDPSRPHVKDLNSYKTWIVRECFNPFADISLPVEDLIVDKDKAAVRWVFKGTHKETGKKIEQEGISIYRFAGGKIVEAWCACDMLGTVQQMIPETD